MSEHLRLGQIITTPQERDCVHIAVCPVVAACDLPPGLHVRMKDGQAEPGKGDTIGVVDPYLRKPVARGERFWLFLYPGSITSLRHLWTHPALPMDDSEEARTAARDVSRNWLEKLARDNDTDLDTLLKASGAIEGDYMLDETSAHDLSSQTDSERGGELFWMHVETLLGKPVPARERNSYFVCRC